MEKYKVTFEEKERFEVIVEANHRADAEAKAIDAFDNGDYTETENIKVICIGIEEIK